MTGERRSSLETLVQRSEDASPSDGGQGHRGPGTTRLFPEGSGQGGAGSRQGAYSCGVERSGRRGSGTATAPNRECTLSAGRRQPRRPSPTQETRQDTGDAPTPPSASAAVRTPLPVARPSRPRGGGACAAGREVPSATRRRLRARGGAGSGLRPLPRKPRCASEVAVTTARLPQAYPLVLWARSGGTLGFGMGSVEVMG